MEKIECAVVNDLLPLYCDEVVSERTAEIVAEHLKECESCKAELEKIKEALPAEKEKTDTREKFRRFIKKHRIKQFAIGTLAVVAAILAFIFMLTIPVVEVSGKDIAVVKAYRYENERGEKKFFILYKSPIYGFSTTSKTGHGKVKNTKGAKSGKDCYLELNEYKPLISGFKTGYVEDTRVYSAESIYGDIDELRFAGKVIWTEEKNRNDPVPEYVYYLEELMQAGSWSWTIDFEQNIIGGAKGAHEPQYWTIEGERLTPPEENQ